MPFVLLSKMCLGAYFWSWPKSPLWLTLPLFLSENLTYLTSFIEEIVCRNTCFECINNYNIWIIFYIFLWNYESIKVGVHLVFNTTSIWDWHRFTAVIWKNDTKRFIFPKLKMISVQHFEDNTTVLCTFCWTRCFFVNTRNFYINIINITEKNGYGGLYQWPLICFIILLRNNCHIGGHFENKMAAIALKSSR